jgi:hypothetical protein
MPLRPFMTKAYRLLNKKYEKPLPLHTFLLIFEVPWLPTPVYIGSEMVPAHLVLSSLRSESGHSNTSCPNALHCVNCGGDYPSANKKSTFLINENIHELRGRKALHFLKQGSNF